MMGFACLLANTQKFCECENPHTKLANTQLAKSNKATFKQYSCFGAEQMRTRLLRVRVCEFQVE